ncbi:MAG: NAD-binding protein [Pseudonocardiaceae bacterium]
MTMAGEQASRDGWLQIGAATVAVVAFGLGVVGLARQSPGGRWPDLVYNALQLFVLGSDRLQGTGPYPWELEVARFLAPLTTVVAVLVTLRVVLDDELRRRRVARAAGHAIVCGDGPEALILARNLQADGTPVVLVRSAEGERPCGESFPLVVGDARDSGTLRAAGLRGSRTLYACDSHSATNAAVALAAGTLRTGHGDPLTAFVQVRNDDLFEALRVRRMAGPRTPGATIGFFALDDIAARMLIERHPPEPRPTVVIGFGTFGEAVVRAMVRRPGSASGATVIVAGAEPDRVVEVAARLNAVGRGWTVRPGAEGEGAGAVYVCLDDEDAAISAGLRLTRAGDRPVVVCLQRANPFRDALDSGGALRIFGVLDEACTGTAIAEDSIIGRAARAIHEQYLVDATLRGDTPDTNSSLVPWRDLPPHLQESNYAQAEHIGTKLRAIGASLATVPPTQPFEFSAEEIDRLAWMEHRRWMDERLAGGFVYGPRREGREHPDLVDWPDLSRESRQKDVDAVAQLPDLLASAGLFIRRGAAG